MVNIELDGSVTFLLDAPEAHGVEVVGAFRGWDEQAVPMHRLDDGTWCVTIDPAPGVYLFRFRVDGTQWRIDDAAHGTVVGDDGAARSRVWRPPLRLDPDAIAA